MQDNSYSRSTSQKTFIDIEQKEKTQLKRVINFLQGQYEGLASQLANKQLELKKAKCKTMPNDNFEMKNYQYETKSQINQIRFNHMTEMQQAIAEHQYEIKTLKNQFEEKFEKQHQNYRREVNRIKKQSLGGKFEEQMIQVSEKNKELNKTVSKLQIQLRQVQKNPNNRQIQHLKQIIKQKQFQIADLTQSLEQAQQYIQSLKSKLNQQFSNNERRGRFDSKQYSTSKFSSIQNNHFYHHHKTKTQNQYDQLTFTKQQNQRLRNLNDRYKKSITEKQSQNYHLNSKNNQLQQVLVGMQSLTQQLKQYKAGKKIFESEMIRLNQQIQTNLTKISQKQQIIVQPNQTILRLNQESNSLKIKIQDEIFGKGRLDDLIKRQNDKLSSLQDTILSLNNQIQKKDKQITQIKNQSNESSIQYKGLQIVLQTKQQQNISISDQNRQYLFEQQLLKNQLNQQKRAHDEIKHRIFVVEQDNNDLLESLKEIKILYQNVRIQNSTLKEFQDSCKYLKEEILKLQNRVKEGKQELRKQIEESYKYKLDMQSVMVQLNQMEQRVRQLQNEKVQFRDRQQLMSELKKYVQMIQDTTRLNGQLNQHIRGLKRQNQQIMLQKIQLQKKINKVEQKVTRSKSIQISPSTSQLQSQITRLKLLLKNIQNQKTYLQQTHNVGIKKKDKIINDLQQKILDLSKSNIQKQNYDQQQFNNLHQFSVDAQLQINNLKTQLTSIIQQNMKIKDHYLAQQQIMSLQMSGLKEELKRKNNQNTSLNKKLLSLNQQHSQRISSDKQLSLALESRLISSNNKLEQTQCNLKDQQKSLQKLNKKYQNTLLQAQSLETQLNKLIIQEKKLRQQYQVLVQQKQNLVKQIKSKELIYKKELKLLKEQNFELGKNNQQLRQYIEEMQNQKRLKQMQNQGIQEKKRKIEKQNHRLIQELKRTKSQILVGKSEHQNYKRKQQEIPIHKASFSQVLSQQDQDSENGIRKQLQERDKKLKQNKNQTKAKSSFFKESQRCHTLQNQPTSNKFQLQHQIKRLHQQIRFSNLQFEQLLKYRSDLQFKLIQTSDQLHKTRQQLSHYTKCSVNNKDSNQIFRMTQHIKYQQSKIKQMQNQLVKRQYSQQQKIKMYYTSNTQVLRLKQQLKNVYNQIKCLNNILLQKQAHIDSLMKNNNNKHYSSVTNLNNIVNAKQNSSNIKNYQSYKKKYQPSEQKYRGV